jgi:hypothetical protein
MQSIICRFPPSTGFGRSSGRKVTSRIRLTFFDTAPVRSPSAAISVLSLLQSPALPSTHACDVGYFCRMGVLTTHEENRLKVWITCALEARARLNGWRSIVSDTTDNLPSANNFIRAGFRPYRPQNPWAWPHTLYWRKFIS